MRHTVSNSLSMVILSVCLVAWCNPENAAGIETTDCEALDDTLRPQNRDRDLELEDEINSWGVYADIEFHVRVGRNYAFIMPSYCSFSKVEESPIEFARFKDFSAKVQLYLQARYPWLERLHLSAPVLINALRHAATLRARPKDDWSEISYRCTDVSCHSLAVKDSIKTG